MGRRDPPAGRDAGPKLEGGAAMITKSRMVHAIRPAAAPSSFMYYSTLVGIPSVRGELYIGRCGDEDEHIVLFSIKSR